MMILLILLALMAIYIYLICPRITNRPDIAPLKNIHYAHRGLHNNRTSAPENSMAAFKLAVEAGYGIELDVQLSKEGVPVVFHDMTLKRMCGKDEYVWEQTLEELRKNKLADSNETIPTFEEVLRLVDGKVPLIVEYKLDNPNIQVCELGNKLLEKYPGVYCIESFHPMALRWYRKHRPEIVRGQLSMDYLQYEKYEGKIYWVLKHLLTNFLTRPDFVAYHHKHESVLERRMTRKLGALAVAYTIKSREDYENVKKAFDLFIFEGFMLK